MKNEFYSLHCRALLEISSDALIGESLDGFIIAWNRGAESLFGYRAEEVLGSSIHQIIPDDLISEYRQYIEQLLNGQRLIKVDTTRVNKKGHQVPVSVLLTPVEDSLGNIIGISTITRNIAEHIALTEKSKHLEAIVENSDDAIISKTLDGIVTSWNRGAEKIFGYSAQEMIGYPILKIFPPELVAEETYFLEEVGRGNKIDHYQTKRINKAGNCIDLSVSISPVRDDRGTIIGISKIARDITKEVQQAKSNACGQLWKTQATR